MKLKVIIKVNIILFQSVGGNSNNMSAETLAFLDGMKKRFNEFGTTAERAAVTATDVTKFIVTSNGKTIKTLVFNYKEFLASDTTEANVDLEITIGADDLIDIYKFKTNYQELLASVS